MTWHILYFVYCIDYGAWAVSYCQEASSVDSSLRWARTAKSGCSGNLALEGCQGVPAEMPVACRQQPAGGVLGLAICSLPGGCMCMREKERMCSSIHHCQGLSQVPKQYSSNILPPVRSSWLWNMRMGKHNSIADI